jgi:hypothetical protein
LLSQPLTAESAAQIALLNNSGLKAAVEAVGVAEGQYRAARRLPNPTVEGAMRFSGDERPELEVGAMIDLTDLLMLSSRSGAAGADLEAAKLDAIGSLLDLSYDTRRTVYTHQASAELVELRWVINTAFKWFADHRQDLEQFTLCFINLSAQSLTDEAFIKFVIEQFSQRQIPPNKICFEMAETAAIANLTHVQNFISELRTLGCHFALDEFSCGLSSVAYLKNLPVDFLKIDRVLIKNIVRDPVDQALVKAINEIGRVMKIKTVAGFV